MGGSQFPPMFLEIAQYVDFISVILNRSFPGKQGKFPCNVRIYLIKKLSGR
jgi:hypothetical protein